MRLDLGEDQRAIEEVFSAFFRRESSVAVVRAAEPLGFDPRLWAQLAELGGPGMGAPESAGGGGAGLGDLAVVADHLGQAIAPVPFVEHTVATRLLAAFDLDLDDVVGGARIATLAVRPAPTGAATWPLVPAGAVAHHVVGILGDELVLVSGEPPGVAPRNHAAMPIADRPAQSTSPMVLATGGDARAAFAHAFAEWQTLTAWSLTGIAVTAQAIALEYVKERYQFDRPIGSFQALQQQLADLPIVIAGAQLLAGKAAWAGDRGTPGIVDTDLCDVTDFETLAGMAFLFASDAAALATDRSLHAHGGYGYAEEYDIQLFYRRARGWSLVAGDPAHEALRLADAMFGPVTA
jgi:alkylation response protein AidB-like acyl-CoA dehydrogenase